MLVLARDGGYQDLRSDRAGRGDGRGDRGEDLGGGVGDADGVVVDDDDRVGGDEDIHDDGGLSDELDRLDSDRGRADSIRTTKDLGELRVRLGQCRGGHEGRGGDVTSVAHRSKDARQWEAMNEGLGAGWITNGSSKVCGNKVC